MPAMECTDVVAVTFATLQMRLLSLQVFFSWSDCHKFTCEVSLLKWVKRFERKLNICWGKQELARTCNISGMLREKSNRSKISCGQCKRWIVWLVWLLVYFSYHSCTFPLKTTMSLQRAMFQQYSLCWSSDVVSAVTMNHQRLLWNVRCIL